GRWCDSRLPGSWIGRIFHKSWHFLDDQSEIRGAVMGLKKAWDHGYRSVELQLDSIILLSLLSDLNIPCHHYAAKVLDFCDLAQRN
ncbi:hypothetical protein LINPERHAP1_LOCUS10635, partial [Linum perenne]